MNNLAIHSIHLPTISLTPKLSLEVQPGVIHLCGRNGSGKTSYLKACAGLLPYDGDCVIQGASLRKDPVAYKLQLGYCPDQYEFLENITAQQYLEFVSHAYGLSGDVSRVADDSIELGFQPFWKARVSALSYGNRKKLLLLASRLNSPWLWLLDEPLNGLDKQGETWLTTKINAVARQSCVLLVCHDHGFMAQFGAHVYEL